MPRCDQCQVANINGIRCHAIGQPFSWQDEVRSCQECGQDFTPENRYQRCCDEPCLAAYHGYDTAYEDCQETDAQ
jgi:hypothetical protein